MNAFKNEITYKTDSESTIMRYIFKELQRHFWRTFFSIIGYAIAAVFILIILCITGSNKKDSFGILKSTGTHFIIYIPTSTSCCSISKGGGSVFAEGVKTMMLDNDLLRTIKNTEGIKDAAPCLLFKIYNEGFQSDISIGGIDTASIATKNNVCTRTNLIAGKFISANRDELVAEQSFVVAHNLKLGDTLDVFGGRMVLAGIINSGIKPVKADFYAPIEFVRSILKDKLQCSAPSIDMNVILIEVADARLQDKVIERIRNMMYKFSVSSYNCYEPAYKVMAIIDKSSLGLTILIFIFLILFSAKTQLTALIERFREIGILKSLGWSDFDLSTNILLVSFIQSITGVSLGLIMGIGVIQILKNLEIPLFQYIEFRFRYTSIPLLYCLSLTGALVASIFPIIKIYRTKAGDIIKNYL
jgi:ABC-type lipoprotein release transport system permease subunit